MNHFKYETENDNAGFTVVENIFINEYMPEANGDYLKVYLYGLKDAQNADNEVMSTGQLSRLLDLTESDILKAWEYWQDRKLVRIEESGADRTIVFLNITSLMHYPKVTKKTAAPSADPEFTAMLDTIQRMFGGEPLEPAWFRAFREWIDIYHFTPETVILLVEHALESMEKNPGKSFGRGARLNYMRRVAENWHEEGIVSYQQAEKYLRGYDAAQGQVYDTLKKLGINRSPMEKERQIILSWTQDMGFSALMIDEALKRTNQPNVAYVNGILKSWHDKGYTLPEHLEKEKRIVPAKQQIPNERQEAVQQLEDDILAEWREKAQAFENRSDS